MLRKMTRLARGSKCGGFGASGSASFGRSWASSSDRMPGNSSEPPTSERIMERRLVIMRITLLQNHVSQNHGFVDHDSAISVHKHKLIRAQQRPRKRRPRLHLKLTGRRLERRQPSAIALQELAAILLLLRSRQAAQGEPVCIADPRTFVFRIGKDALSKLGRH